MHNTSETYICLFVFFADGQEEEDAGVESTSRKVVDIIDAFRYQETSYDKKTFMAYIKDYMKARRPPQLALYPAALRLTGNHPSLEPPSLRTSLTAESRGQAACGQG